MIYIFLTANTSIHPDFPRKIYQIFEESWGEDHEHGILNYSRTYGCDIKKRKKVTCKIICQA